MHVAIIADFPEPSGGAQSVAILSALALRARAVGVTYIHGVARPADPRLAEAGVSVVSLGLDDIWDRSPLAGAVTGIWNRVAASRLRGALGSLPAVPTVLHLHQWTRSLSPSILPLLTAAGHPVAITLHDYFIACPNGVYYRFDRGEPCDLRPLSASCLTAPCDPRSSLHKAVRVLRTAATRAAIGRAPIHLVHVSDRGRDTLAAFLGGSLMQHRIDNPVEATPSDPAHINETACLAYIGRLTREKGADLVAVAAARAGMQVLFIGEGPAEAEIRRLNPSAEILGWRPRSEIEALMRTRIRAVAAPSRWYETGPLTVYEAMAAGLPAVASRRSGAAERVDDGETGFVVEPNEDSLADAFRRLAADDVARRLGVEAYRRYWASPPSPAAHAEALIALYRSMLGQAA